MIIKKPAKKNILNLDIKGLGYRSLITTNNAKTLKGESLGFLTGIIYMKPDAKICPLAEISGCAAGCLVSAGRGKMSNVKTAREDRANIFHTDKPKFFKSIIIDILTLKAEALKLDLTPVVRLNGTSDIIYENMPFIYGGVEYANIMGLFPDLQFYDYTKLGTRKNTPENYHLTYSITHTPHALKMYEKARKNPSIKAYALVYGKKDSLPLFFNGDKVYQGDNNDLTFLAPYGAILGLIFKGSIKSSDEAKTTGLVGVYQ